MVSIYFIVLFMLGRTVLIAVVIDTLIQVREVNVCTVILGTLGCGTRGTSRLLWNLIKLILVFREEAML